MKNKFNGTLISNLKQQRHFASEGYKFAVYENTVKKEENWKVFKRRTDALKYAVKLGHIMFKLNSSTVLIFSFSPTETSDKAVNEE